MFDADEGAALPDRRLDDTTIKLHRLVSFLMTGQERSQPRLRSVDRCAFRIAQFKQRNRVSQKLLGLAQATARFLRQCHLGQELRPQPRGRKDATLLYREHLGLGRSERAERLVRFTLQAKHRSAQLTRLRVDDGRTFHGSQTSLLRDRVGQTVCQAGIEAVGKRAIDCNGAFLLRGWGGQRRHGPAEDLRHQVKLASVERVDRLEVSQQPRLDWIAQSHRFGLAEDALGFGIAAKVG